MENKEKQYTIHVDLKIVNEHIKKWEYTHLDEYGCVYGYSLFPGIFLRKNDFYMKKIPNQILDVYSLMKLNYCIQGRCEVSLENNRFVYLEHGMMSLDRNQPCETFIIPNGRYVGVEIIFDMNLLNEDTKHLFFILGIDILDIYNSLINRNGSYLASVSNEWSDEAENLSLKLGTSDCTIEDCRFEVLKLLYLYAKGSTTPLEEICYLTRGQKGIAIEVEEIICSDLKNHYTVETLAKKYKISASTLEKYFFGVYGTSIAKYLRTRRIEYATELLDSTNMAIADIAAEVGYSNQSKFGTVFKFQMNSTPMEYRRLQHEYGGKK